MIYLASPYNHPLVEVRQSRVVATRLMVAHMIGQLSLAVYSPILHNHQLVPELLQLGLPEDFVSSWRFWRSLDLAMLRRSDQLRILKLDGWKESIGVMAERTAALEIDLPITYCDPL